VHISYSALKDWDFCAFYHKLTRIDKIDGFKGNAYTAFGTAMHSVCEKKLLQEHVDDEYFFQEFLKNINNLDDDVEIDHKLVDQMKIQGKQIIPDIEVALKQYFDNFEVLAVEFPLNEAIENEKQYKFKGFIDAIVTTPDGKIHIFDFKTCSWGWDARRKNDKITTYQLTLYKHFFAQAAGIDPKDIETHFALLKRTAKYNKVELFRVTSGPKKTQNALKLLNMALYNIKQKRYIKKRTSCRAKYPCKFYGTEHCK